MRAKLRLSNIERLALFATSLLMATACAGLPSDVVILLEDDDGTTGTIIVRTAGGERVLGRPGEATAFERGDQPPTEPFQPSKEKVMAAFGDALSAQPEPPVSFVLYFETESTDLTPESKAKLPEILVTIAQRVAPDIGVAGHTDRAGTDEYNVRLSLRRAHAVRDALVASGVDPQVIEVTYHGENNPRVPTPDGVHEPLNRRVEVTAR